MGLFDDVLETKEATSSGLFDDVLKAPKSSALRRIADVGVSLGKGVASIPELAVGLADIPTGGRVGKAVQDAGVDFKGIQSSISDLYSPEQQEANRKVQEAKGFGGTIKAAFQNPSTIVGAVAESAPLLIPGMGVSRGLGAVSKLSGLARGAIGEGVTSAGLAAERTRQETDDGTLSAKQSLSALGSGAGTAVLGAVGGKVAQKLGIGDIDTYLAGQAQASKKGIVKRTLGGALAEGGFEELPQSVQEQVWQNYALGKPLDEGVSEAGAMGLLAGGAMGGAFSALNRGQSAPQEILPKAEETLPTAQNQRALLEDQSRYIGTPGSIQTPRTYPGNAEEVARAEANAANIYAERDAFEQGQIERQGLNPANIQTEFADELTASAANQFVSNERPASYLQWAQNMDLGDFILSMPNHVADQAMTINGILNGQFADKVKEQAAARLWKLGQDSRIQTIESLPVDAGPLAKAAAQGASTGAIQLNKYGFTASIQAPGEAIKAGEQSNFANTLKGLPNAKSQRAVTQPLQESSQGGRDNQAGSERIVPGRVGGLPNTGTLEGRKQSILPMGDAQVADVPGVEEIDQYRKSDANNERDWNVARGIAEDANKRMADASARKKAAKKDSVEYAQAELDIKRAWVDFGEAGVLGYPFTSGPEYQQRVENLAGFKESLERTKDIIRKHFHSIDADVTTPATPLPASEPAPVTQQPASLPVESAAQQRQRRAAIGGEFGANGEWYAGGKFIATTDRAKQNKKWKKPTGRVEIDKGVYGVRPQSADNVLMQPLLGSLGGYETRNADGSFSFNSSLSGDFATPEVIESRKESIDAWNAGARWTAVAIDESGARTIIGYETQPTGEPIAAQPKPLPTQKGQAQGTEGKTQRPYADSDAREDAIARLKTIADDSGLNNQRDIRESAEYGASEAEIQSAIERGEDALEELANIAFKRNNGLKQGFGPGNNDAALIANMKPLSERGKKVESLLGHGLYEMPEADRTALLKAAKVKSVDAFENIARADRKAIIEKWLGVEVTTPASIKTDEVSTPAQAKPNKSKKSKVIEDSGEYAEYARKQFINLVKIRGGVISREARDITGEPVKIANRQSPGMFRNNGKELDYLAEQLHEAGYLTNEEYESLDGGVERVRELIRTALNKEYVGTMAQDETYAKLKAEEAYLSQQVDQNQDDIADDLVTFLGATTVPKEDAMAALGFTEEQINEITSGITQEASDGTAGRNAQKGDETRADQEADGGFALAGETAEEVKAKEAEQATQAKAEQEAADKAEAEARRERIKKEDADRKAIVMAEREAAKKAEVDATVDDFQLGQEAPAKISRRTNTDDLAGQGDIFASEHTINDVPASFLLSHTVTVPIYNSESNTYESGEASAKEALDATRGDIDQMKSLLACLKG